MKGYTLVEILVVVSIIGLLFSFGFVNFREYSRRQQLKNAATALSGNLRMAQEKALSGEVPAGCVGLKSYGVKINATDYRILARCASDIQIGRVNLVAVTAAAVPQSTVSFKVLGSGTDIPVGSQMVITLTQTETGQTTTVTVTPGGEIK